MRPLPEAEVLLDLLLLVLVVVPTGAAVLRLGERLLRRKFRLTVPERVLLALYAGGATLFILASIPLPFYGYPLLLAVLVGGAVAYAVICYREGAIGLRAAVAYASTPPAMLLGLLTLGVLLVEVQGVASLTLTNMLDGSLHSLFINLLISNHTLPSTFNPYAAVGVTYPQGAPVWMSVPVLLFGWPIVSAPLEVPALFLALSTVAAYCLGERLGSRMPGVSGPWIGLLFAAFFGFVASWPRLAVGGSLDFALGLPLFILTLGWLVAFVSSPQRSWTDVIALGTVIGVEISLSLMLGVGALLMLAGYVLAYRTSGGLSLGQWTLRWLAMVGISAGFLVRSLVAIALWFNYPGHVLLPVGNPPPAPAPPQLLQPLTYAYATGELDPFLLFKPKVSPIPVLSLEILVLLTAGLLLAGLVLARPSDRLARYLPRALVVPILVGAAVAFAETAGILLANAATLSASGVGSVTNIEEASTVLFIFYELIAILPLVAAAGYVAARAHDPGRPVPAEAALPPPRNKRREPRRRPSTKVVLVALVLLIPLLSGLGVTAVEVPGYITDHIHQLANVSEADLAALQWAGTNLPSCSRVLVAPGSIGQYLPEFSSVALVYPAFPTPGNLSYYLVVQDLDAGVYTNATHQLLLELGVTEVFASGQNTVSFPPFQSGMLHSSPDFTVLTAMGDVTIFGFLPGVAAAGCPV